MSKEMISSEDDLLVESPDETKKTQVIEKIIDNYCSLEKSIVNQLDFSNPNHIQIQRYWS